MRSDGVTISESRRLRSSSGDAAQIVAVEIQQIEQKQVDRRGSGKMRNRVGVRHRDARLNQAEAGAALVIQHRDLAVQDRLRCFDLARQDAQLGILLVAALLRARENAELVVLDEAQRADAVPFHFVEPRIARRRTSGERGEHGGHRCAALATFTAPGRHRVQIVRLLVSGIGWSEGPRRFPAACGP